ncbi:MAG TPA: glutamate formimidoyltransferase [Planctomycetota bacterium]|nr:glutamate formimidoyltransferase [Planctomycetota bacterium]
MSLVECVPNFSEGRRPEVIDRIVAALASAPGVRVIDRSMDAGHNRAVVTFIGSDRDVGEAAFRAIGEAQREIDLRSHSGEHPRIGATDVVPFVPVSDVSLARCVEIAHALGERVGRELEIPVYFYEAAAKRPTRRNLPDVRNIGFEKLLQAVATDPERAPDCGPARLHPSAGAVVIGARQFLIAFNVNLKSKDTAAAKEIAKKIREKDGGLPGIKAMGFFLDDLQCAQVSMNVCDFTRTGLVRVYEEIEKLAAERGIEILESELVGLAPRAALGSAVAARIHLRGFDPARQIVEELI